MSQRTGMLSRLRLEASDAELHAAARTVVLRVAQEALRNIAKHSGATRAWVRTYRSTGTMRRTATGCWKSATTAVASICETVAANPNRRHFGLRFMRERSDLLGSQLAIQTSPAGGTLVRLTIDPREERSQGR